MFSEHPHGGLTSACLWEPQDAILPVTLCLCWAFCRARTWGRDRSPGPTAGFASALLQQSDSHGSWALFLKGLVENTAQIQLALLSQVADEEGR